MKIWDFGSGQEIRAWTQPDYLSEKDEDMSITGLQYLEFGERKLIMATGWNNTIKLLEVGIRTSHNRNKWALNS